MTERILSPDGTQYWDGTTWNPVGEQPSIGLDAAPHPDTARSTLTQPTASSPVSAAAGSAAFPAAQPAAYTGGYPGITPQLASHLNTPTVNSWAATKWAWRLALTPFLFVALFFFPTENPGDTDMSFWTAALACLAGATALCAADVKALQRRGVAADQGFTAGVLLLYVVGAPAYLIYRTVKSRSTWMIPLTWFAAAAVSFAGLYFFINEDGSFRNPTQPTPALDVPALETDLASEMRDLGARGVEVDCPDDEAYGDGDMVMCAVTTTSDGPLEIFLDMRNDGYYRWEVQQP